MPVIDAGVLPLIAAGLSLALCLFLTPLAKFVGLMDQPSRRKLHANPVPLVGGPAIFFTLAGMMLIIAPDVSMVRPLLLACSLMFVTGLIDDRQRLSPRLRLILQAIACCIMIFGGGVVLTDFGSILWNGVFSLAWFSVPVTIFAAIGLINAFNMVDGMDGLSSAIFMTACAAMAWLAFLSGHIVNSALLLAAFGAVLGYFLLNARLPWNRRARVFLGDSGSIFLGLFLAWQFVELSSGERRSFQPMTAVWLIAIPLLDTTRLMGQRWRRGGSAFKADQFHLHHAFLKAGFSVQQTWMAIICMVTCTTAIGLAGHIFGWPEYLMFYTFIAFSVVYVRLMNHCWSDGRFLGRSLASDTIV